MLAFLKAGGFATWFILLFGLITLFASASYARTPSDKLYRLCRSLSACTVFASLSGLCSALAAVMFYVPANPAWANSPKIHLIIMQGLGESLSCPILGFSILCICWLVISVGTRRQTYD